MQKREYLKRKKKNLEKAGAAFGAGFEELRC